LPSRRNRRKSKGEKIVRNNNDGEFGIGTEPSEEMPRPVLIRGGRCWVSDKRGKPGRVVEALLLAEGRIAALGTDEDVRSHPKASGAERLELNGETVIPGMTDSHCHAYLTAQNRCTLDLSDCASLREALSLIRETARTMDRGDWIHGTGFTETRWPESRIPSRWDLDDLEVPQPILLTRSCVHVRVGNGEALRRAGLPDAPDRSGILMEAASTPLMRAYDRWVRESGVADRALEDQLLDWTSRGVTELHTCCAEDMGVPESLLAYQRLRARGRLPLRILLYSDQAPPFGMGSGFGDGWIRYGGFKFFADGAMGGRTAALSAPYADDPGNRGEFSWDDEALFLKAKELHRRGIQLQIHTIGDGALDQVIRLLSRLRDLGPHPLGFRHRINHAMICRDDQLAALEELNPVLDIQPAFVPSDLPMLESRMGPERISWCYRWGDFVRRGLTVTGSSDSPVEPISPFRGIWAALVRTDPEGCPAGGIGPRQKLTLDEALGIFTRGPAEATRETWKGRLAPGLAADVTVCDRDLFAASPEEIRETRASAVFVEGLRIL
jgi:predicted amidohydrolase YtcJ